MKMLLSKLVTKVGVFQEVMSKKSGRTYSQRQILPYKRVRRPSNFNFDNGDVLLTLSNQFVFSL
jgi:hypothetical protein